MRQLKVTLFVIFLGMLAAGCSVLRPPPLAIAYEVRVPVDHGHPIREAQMSVLHPYMIASGPMDHLRVRKKEGYEVYMDSGLIQDRGPIYLSIKPSEKSPMQVFRFRVSRFTKPGGWSPWLDPEFETGADNDDLDLFRGRSKRHTVKTPKHKRFSMRYRLSEWRSSLENDD